MQRFRPRLSVIRRGPLPIRRILLLAILLGAGVGGLWGTLEELSPARGVAPNPPSSVVPTLSGTVSVIDGDTLDLHGQRIRLHGIDAPESRQTCRRAGETWRCGQQAALALVDHIARRPVSCEQRDIDRYQRIVAVCRLNGDDLNSWLVRAGWAMAYRSFSNDYVADEAAARAARRGIWAGEVQPPWEWRRKPKD